MTGQITVISYTLNKSTEKVSTQIEVHAKLTSKVSKTQIQCNFSPLLMVKDPTMLLLLVKPKFGFNISSLIYDGLFVTWEMIESLLPSKTLVWLIENVLRDITPTLKDLSLTLCDFEKLTD